MKKIDYPEQDTRSTPFEPAKPDAESEAPRPRPLEMLASPTQDSATRNLAVGVGLLVLALIAVWFGMYFDARSVIVGVVVSFGTFGLVWLLGSSRILRQPHGTFFSLALVACFGAIVPFLIGGLQKLDAIARSQHPGNEDATAITSAPLPVPTRDTAPPPPLVADPEPIAIVEKKPEPPAPLDDGIVRELMAPAPDPSEGKVIRINEDTELLIAGRKWKAPKGQLYRYLAVEDGIVTFVAGNQQAQIPLEAVTFTGQSRETPAKILQMAQMEAMSRYPALAEKDSPENITYRIAVEEMKNNPELKEVLFKDPKWPLVLAEQLAAQHGWKRADLSADADADAATPPTPLAPEGEPVPRAPEQGKPDIEPAGEAIPKANVVPARQMAPAPPGPTPKQP